MNRNLPTILNGLNAENRDFDIVTYHLKKWCRSVLHKSKFVWLALLVNLISSSLTESFGATITSSATGNWNAAGTWPSTTRSGSITSSTGSATVTGSGTSFLNDVSVGTIIQNSGGTTIGTVQSIESNTSLTLTSNAAVNATNNANWQTDGTPGPGDNIVIVSNHNVTVNGTYTCNSINVAPINNNISALTFNSGSELTVNGTVTLGDPGNTNRRGSIVMTSGGKLICDGLALGNTGTNSFTPGTGTIELTATNTIPTTIFTTFYNLNINGGTTTIGAAKSIINGGTLSLITGTLFAGTNLSMSSTSNISRSGGSMTGTLQGSGVYDVTYTGNTKTAGPELNNTGLRNVTVNLTAGQTLTLDANRTPDGDLSVSSGTFDLSTLTINRSASGGTLAVSNGATLKIGGGNTMPSNYSTHSFEMGSTVEYSGTSNQNVSAETYGDLVFSGGSVNKVFQGATTINGNLSISTNTKANLNSFNSTAISLTLGGIDQPNGSYGGTGSGATNINTTTLLDIFTNRMIFRGKDAENIS